MVDERPNPYGFIPFIIFPNLRDPKRFWGISDIPILMEPARELNRALSQLSTILELSGNPIAVLEGVEEARDIAVEPGAVWELPDQARAYLLDLLQGGGAKLHADYIKLVYDALHDLSESPRISFGHNPQRLSGVALEMEMHPLIAAGAAEAADPLLGLPAEGGDVFEDAGKVRRTGFRRAMDTRGLGSDSAPGSDATGPAGAEPRGGWNSQQAPGHGAAGGHRPRVRAADHPARV